MATHTCINPFSGQESHFEIDNFDVLKQKVSILKENQNLWKDIDIHSRIDLIQSGLNYFTENKDQVAKDISEQMGRPLSQCQGEIDGLFERANYLSKVAVEALQADEFTDKHDHIRKIEHTPLGVIFVISAWNYPLLITINSIIPALLSGNTVLLKHSALTPKIGKHFESAFKKLGSFDNLLLQTVTTHETTGQCIEKLPIDHVIFTGSVNGGRAILNHCTKKFISPTLELGGKDAAYVHKDAHIKNSAASVIDGAMFNSGQSCCGLERCYVHESVYDSFIEEAKKVISQYKLGDPNDPTTNIGPLAQKKAKDLIEGQLQEAKEQGAIIEYGGQFKTISEGLFLEPTIVVNTNQSMKIMQEENFAPILAVMKVSSINKAIEYVNDSDFGLTSAIYTSDVKVAKYFSDRVETGSVFMNRCDYLDPALAWVGVKNSGMGFSLSKYAFKSVTRKKSLNFKTS